MQNQKRIEIEHICLAYVVNEFAMMLNQKYRGESFTWQSWIERIPDRSKDWLFVHNVYGDKKVHQEYAKAFTLGLCLDLIEKAGIMEE